MASGLPKCASLSVDEDSFRAAAEDYLREPSEDKMSDIITTYMMPIAGLFARKISFTREDREDAEQEILAHMADALRPQRRARFDSPIRKKQVQGLEIGLGTKVFAFFFQVAKGKACDIVKSRVRKYRRECAIAEAEFLERALKGLGKVETGDA